MTEPRIQYCTAPDGVNLAFCTEGEGPPIVYTPTFNIFGHLQIQTFISPTSSVLEYLTRRMHVIQYDRRGQGLSDREVSDESLEAHVRDLLTVIDHVGVERVTLIGRIFGGPVAATVAHRYPERVSHLILLNTAARLADTFDGPRQRVYQAMLDNDWEFYTEVVSRAMLGWSEHDAVARLIAQTRASITPEGARRTRDIVRAWDVSGILARLAVPTLVIHAPTSIGPPDDRLSRQLAAGIPRAQIRVFEAMGEETARAVYEFVSGERPAAAPAAPSLPEGTAIILFADIVDSTALTEQLGDAVFRARASRLDAVMRVGIRECGGTPVEGKVMGDGIMAVFSAARQAIDAAFRCRAALRGQHLRRDDRDSEEEDTACEGVAHVEGHVQPQRGDEESD